MWIILIILAFGLLVLWRTKIAHKEYKEQKESITLLKIGDRVSFSYDYSEYDIVIRKGTPATVTESNLQYTIISIDGMPFEMRVLTCFLDKAA